ncbi:MAG: hypothetical protein JXR37_31975 [Kiritimatiellae bacterium]|nr:hypothetical protein [Kiritimatiellia bacterium]
MNKHEQYGQSGGPSYAPPPLPATAAGHKAEQAPKLMNGFEEHYEAVAGTLTLGRVIEALLKAPARIVHEIVEGRSARATAMLLAVTVGCMLIYGWIMGTFSGGHQLWVVPAKTATGLVLSALICLPSLYIFSCLSGADQSFGHVAGLLAQTVALTGILLVGFAPVAWIFAQSTNTVAFMGFLHLLFWGVGSYFGLRLLWTALTFLNRRVLGILWLWNLIFIAVVLQMTTTLRPLVAKFEGFELQEKKGFVVHWTECMR